MAVLLQRADGGVEERMVVAVGEGMTAHDLDLHPQRHSDRFCSVRCGAGCYALFFADPDGPKLEFVHWP